MTAYSCSAVLEWYKKGAFEGAACVADAPHEVEDDAAHVWSVSEWRRCQESGLGLVRIAERNPVGRSATRSVEFAGFQESQPPELANEVVETADRSVA